MFLSFRCVFALGAFCLAIMLPFQGARASSERMTLYEVNKFLAAYDAAVSSPDTGVGTSFLAMNVSSRAQFDTVVMAPDYGRGYGYGQANYAAYPQHMLSYRYPAPYANGAYIKPVSHFNDDKAGIISMLHAKKSQIPGYAQKIDIEGFTMESMARHAEVKISLKEYGTQYHDSAYGYIQHVLQFQSDCVMNLSKDRGRIGVTGMNCNLLTR